MIKTTAAEFTAFLRDDWWWPEESYIDGESILFNGEKIDYDKISELPPESVIKIDGEIRGSDNRELCSLGTHLKRWRASKKFKFIVVKAPFDKLEDIKSFVESAGGKIV